MKTSVSLICIQLYQDVIRLQMRCLAPLIISAGKNTVESFASGTSQTCCSKSGICRKYKSTVNRPSRILSSV